MADKGLERVVQHVRQLMAVEHSSLSDGELLERFVRQRDEAAFTVLALRHGPMVLGVCRGILKDAHDAEDACQAAFLVLARRAGSIRKRASAGSWLHGVAFRAAANLRRHIARRRGRELPSVEVAQSCPMDVSWREVRSILDEELQRLPERFRAPLLLCCLEGRTRDEAAHELGWSPGTLRGRLERGRELLQARLKRRGVGPSALVSAPLLGRAASEMVSPALVMSIVRSTLPGAAGVVSARAAVLAQAIGRSMMITKLKLTSGALLAFCLFGLAAGLLPDGSLSARSTDGEGGAGSAQESPQFVDDSKEQLAISELAHFQSQSRNNLKQLAQAMHKYFYANESLPAPALYAGGKLPPRSGEFNIGISGKQMGSLGGSPAGPPGPPGQSGSSGSVHERGLRAAESSKGPGKGGEKALLSWRVAILPYLGELDLYRQFKMDEPWDGPQNKKLLEKMPKVFACPGVKTRDPYSTFYQIFVGPGAIFEQHQRPSFPHSITDGTSNTILIAEAGTAVPWTKPEDMKFAPDKPLPELGGPFAQIINVALADGQAITLQKTASEKQLCAAITCSGGEVMDLDTIKAPTSLQGARLSEQNLRLKRELATARTQLDKLRREHLGIVQQDADTDRLRKENEQLESQLRAAREETDLLRQAIDQLRRRSEKRPQEWDATKPPQGR